MRKHLNSIEDMIAIPASIALAVRPNHMRIENMEAIVHASPLAKSAHRNSLRDRLPQCRRSETRGRACRESGLLHGYLENQLFTAHSTRSRTDLARGRVDGQALSCAGGEEHSGPHMPWFWQGELQGGGVLNDYDVPQRRGSRYLLTEPGKPRASIRPAVSAQIAS